MKCAIFTSKYVLNRNLTEAQYYMPQNCYKQVTLQQDSKFHHWQPLGHSTHTTPHNMQNGLCTKRQHKHTKRIPTCHSQEHLITIQSYY